MVKSPGQFDDTRCLIEWKATSSRNPEEPDGLLTLDPQLGCYSERRFGIKAERVLPDVDSRPPTAAGEKGTEGSGLDEEGGTSEAGTAGRAALRVCNLDAQGSRDAQGAV